MFETRRGEARAVMEGDRNENVEDLAELDIDELVDEAHESDGAVKVVDSGARRPDRTRWGDERTAAMLGKGMCSSGGERTMDAIRAYLEDGNMGTAKERPKVVKEGG